MDIDVVSGSPRHTADSSDPRVMRTRRLISKAFHNLLDELPVEKITVSAVAKRAGVNRKTFYLHYSSMEDLMQRDAEVIATQLAESILKVQAETPGKLDLTPVFSEMTRLVQQRPSVYRRVFCELSLNRLLDLFSTPLEHQLASARGLTNPDDVRSCSYLVRYCMAGTLAVFSRYFEEDDTPSTEEIVAIVENAGKLLETQLSA